MGPGLFRADPGRRIGGSGPDDGLGGGGAGWEGTPPSSPPPPRRRSDGWIAVIDRLLDVVLAFTVVACSAAIFTQVVFRYAVNRPISWADEFAVLVFAWMVFVGAVVAQRTDSHIGMDTFVRLTPRRGLRLALDLFRYGAIAVILAVLFWQGLALTRRMASVDYPAMGVSRGFLYATLPVCVPLFALYLVRCVVRRVEQFRAGTEGGAEPDERR